MYESYWNSDQSSYLHPCSVRGVFPSSCRGKVSDQDCRVLLCDSWNWGGSLVSREIHSSKDRKKWIHGSQDSPCVQIHARIGSLGICFKRIYQRIANTQSEMESVKLTWDLLPNSVWMSWSFRANERGIYEVRLLARPSHQEKYQDLLFCVFSHTTQAYWQRTTEYWSSSKLDNSRWERKQTNKCYSDWSSLLLKIEELSDVNQENC